MTVNPRALASTLRTLAPMVLASMAASVLGLVVERSVVPPGFFHSSNEVVGSYLQTLGTVYAVLLAFVVFVVWTQFNETRQYVEEEANELLDLVRTAKGFSDPVASELHRQALLYVDAVLGPEWTAMETDTEPNLTAGADMLESLWSVLRHLDLASECERAVYSEVLGRFNDLSDARARRIASSRLRIPLALWVLLQFGAVVTVGSMYLFHVQDLLLLAVITALLAGALSHVLYVIRDLDNCFSGAWRVPRAPFEHVRSYVQAALRPAAE